MRREAEVLKSWSLEIRREGSTCLRSYGICAADDLSHYDVTSEPVREISMAAKK